MKNATNRKTTKADERNLIEAAVAAGKPVKKLAAQAKPTKGKKRAKAETIPLPAGPVKGSVVAKAWKAKAGKSGVWKDDAVRNAVKSAFLAEGGNDVEPADAARKATDAILAENHLDVGRWAGKNPGMLAMNLSNVLRGLVRNDGVCFVRGKKIS